MPKYVIMYNTIDEKYKLVHNKENASASDFCIVDGNSVSDVLHDANVWFDISPKEVEL